jgi:hypothetical protein
VIKFNLADLKKHATGFAGVHGLNAGLSMGYAVVQTVVFARALDHRLFALTILIQTVSFYMLPLNQSVARANFVLLREGAVRDAQPRAPEAAVAFNVSQALLLTVSLLAPMALAPLNAFEYATFASLMVANSASNMWYFEIQMSLMAVDRAIEYEMISFLRRFITYVLLILIFITRSLFDYSIALLLVNLGFHVYITRKMARRAGLYEWPGLVTLQGLRAHLARLWVAFQAVIAEWLTMNGPYAIFSARFGVGPGLVTIDTVLKLLRTVTSATRSLAEVTLPHVSRALLLGDTGSARLPAVFAFVGGGLGALIIGFVVAVWQKWSFGLLLGPNNVVPHAAGWPAAVTLIAGVGIATGGHFIGHVGDHRSVRVLSATAISAVGLLAAYILIQRPEIVPALWMVAACMSVISITAMTLLAKMLKR